jgi:predicted Zn-ribbon and HTH transcriptional regulator
MKNTHILLGGHIFNRDSGVCDKCGLTKNQYLDSSRKPRCTGQRPAEERRFSIDEDEGE